MALMVPTQAICQIRVRDSTQVPVRLCSVDQSLDLSIDSKILWTKSILRALNDLVTTSSDRDIRDLDLELNDDDGSVKNNADDPPASSTSPNSSPVRREYPAHYQLPEALLHRLNDAERNRRKELFAIGCLIYELSSGQKPFHDKSEEEVQALYNQAHFPDDVWAMPTATGILCCWCPQSVQEPQVSLYDKLSRHAREHPILLSCQVVGAVGSIAAGFAVPILGAVGFAATGPVAGSAAAAWQASIGLVRAGSLFAWCQSAAMGGAAVGGIVATGASGLTVVAGATALQMLDKERNNIPPSVLRDRFMTAWNNQFN